MDLLINRETTPVLSRPRLAEELVSFLAPASVEAEQYRTLRHAIERLRRDSGFQVFAVTSATPGDGKTVTTLNLAGSLAQARTARVLVICGDLHRRSAPEYLGLADTPGPGLAEAVLNDDYTLDRVVRRFDALNVSVLLPGDVQTPPYELLASPRMETLIAQARQRFDYILIDTPPVIPLADCRLIEQSVDGFIVVVGAGKTPRRLVAEAVGVLDPAKLIGVVFNGD
jgi:capsular exopolysaccharide synthesis family protein